MKQKLRDRLDRIEKALKELTKEVRALHPSKHLMSDGDKGKGEAGRLIPFDKPKSTKKAGKTALRRPRKKRLGQ
jgi:hypothetical protein